MRVDRHRVAEDNRRAGVALGIGLQRNAPQNPAVAQIITGQRIRGEIDNLPDAGQRRNHGRGVGRLVLTRFPQHLAGPLVEGDQRRPIRAPHRHNHRLAVHHARSVVAASRRGAVVGFGAEKFDAEILFEARPPNHVALRQAQAPKLPVARLHVNAVAVDERRAARSGAPFVLETVGEGNAPNFLPRLRIEQVCDFLLAVLIEADQSARRDHGSRKAAAHPDFPNRFEVGRQRGRNRCGLGNLAISRRPMPLRPVTGEQTGQRCAEEQNRYPEFHGRSPGAQRDNPDRVVKAIQHCAPPRPAFAPLDR